MTAFGKSVPIFALLVALAFSAMAQSPAPEDGTFKETLIQAALNFAKAQSKDAAGQYRFTLRKAPQWPVFKGTELRFEASHLSKRQPIGVFFATFKLFEKGRQIGTLRVDMEGQWAGNVLRVKESLPRHAVPQSHQLESEYFEGIPPGETLSEWPQGHRLRVPLATGRMLTQNDLEPIPLITSGDPVHLTLCYQDLSITLEALSRSNGTLNSQIRLELPSGKWVLAKITGPGQAKAQWR